MNRHFTEEDIAVANNVDLVQFLKSQGETLLKSGKDMRWARNHSVTVRGNQYFEWEKMEGGYPIQFLKQYYQYGFQEAMEILLSFENDSDKTIRKKNPEIKKEFELPLRNNNMNRVYGYLLNTRFLDKDVLDRFVKLNMVYEDVPYHNVVFVGYDEHGVARHAHKRTTYTKARKQYRGNVESSDPNYSFHYTGDDDRVYVFEAPIDMLSYISLNKEGWDKHSYVALNGLGIKSLEKLLELNTGIDKVYLCFDHDIAGMEGAERTLDLLRKKGMMDVTIILPKNKDFNEDLKEQHNCIVLPSEVSAKRKELYSEIEELSVLADNPIYSSSNYEEHMKSSFSQMYYAYSRSGKNDYILLNEKVTDFLMRVLSYEHQLIESNDFFNKKSLVFKNLENDYRLYKDKDVMNKQLDRILEGMKKIYESKDSNHATKLSAVKECASEVMYMKLKIRRELTRYCNGK